MLETAGSGADDLRVINY